MKNHKTGNRRNTDKSTLNSSEATKCLLQKNQSEENVRYKSSSATFFRSSHPSQKGNAKNSSKKKRKEISHSLEEIFNETRSKSLKIHLKLLKSIWKEISHSIEEFFNWSHTWRFIQSYWNRSGKRDLVLSKRFLLKHESDTSRFI